ncbi:sporulation protein YqfD [Petroclostridium sp. X23]|uniref:sporulation protein YqfD n=1 Tax=Petroclostridium sp. X23 TaxID=3045146 RepID=UPI0024AD1A8A|nr:sporulation protein YqfD [Petroclostridium sp. X23]WHH59580.1 sporulation protein YqfD [Petroclostridium sp. X23]
MLLVNLFSYFKGYVTILVEGYFIEKFINICTRRQIYLWDIKKINSCAVKMKVSIKGFKALKPVAHKTKCRVKILYKKGTPFIMHRYRKRKTFMLGVLLFCALLWYLTSFIWIIDISGNNDIKREEILTLLEQSGLKVGSLKMGLDTDHIENEMMIRLNQLSWIGIDIKGTKAVIDIKLRRMPPKIVEKHIPCNIIATKDGVIRSMIVKSGQPMVKIGDTVSKGQLLVSGIMDSKVQGIRYSHSVASVKARTWYERSKEVPLKRSKRIKTGNKMEKNVLKILDKQINLYLNSSIPYANYDKMTYSRELTLGKEYVLPVTLETNVYEEVLIEEENISLDDAVSQAVNSMNEEIRNELDEGTELVDRQSDHIFIDENNIVVKLTVEAVEEIAIQEEIIKSDQEIVTDEQESIKN